MEIQKRQKLAKQRIDEITYNLNDAIDKICKEADYKITRCYQEYGSLKLKLL